MATVNATTANLVLSYFDTLISRTGIIWPSDLPRYFLSRGYSETPITQSLRSEVDIGLAQVRRRYSIDLKEVNGNMRMSQEQLNSFETWYINILEGGTQTFLMLNVLSLETRLLRFKNPYNISHEGGVYYQVSLQLEIMP